VPQKLAFSTAVSLFSLAHLGLVARIYLWIALANPQLSEMGAEIG
jgi:hypothetical protein